MGSLAQKYINEGISQGISQGVDIGKAEGLKIGEERIKRIAINMLRSGLDVKMIASTTSLSLREIEKLKAEMPTLPDAS